jgi:hypothetical protein
MTDFFATPDDNGEIRQSDLQYSLGERLGAQALDALDPKDSPSGMWLFRRAREAQAGGQFDTGGLDTNTGFNTPEQLEQAEQVRQADLAAIPDTSIADAKARVKQEGLEHSLNLPDQPNIKSPVLDLMIQEAHERRDREVAIARGPQGFLPGALGLVTSLGAGMIDPVNMAAFSIPVLGEARMGKLLASAGDSLFARAGIRALEGGAQGAVGTAVLQPADWWLHTQDGQDYTFADALKSIAMGAGMGAAFHAGIGAFGDIRSTVRGEALPGSPADLLQQGLAKATPAGESPGIVSSEVEEPPYGIGRTVVTIDGERTVIDTDLTGAGEAEIAGNSPPLHPAETLADLPPAAREDAMRSAVADVIADRPVRAGDMLDIAADHDPRIAEAYEPERISAATIEHEGVTYEGANHAEALDKLESSHGVRLDDISDEALSAGFATSKGRIVGRDEALGIAQRAGQHAPEQVNRLPNDAPSNVAGLVAEETRMAPGSDMAPQLPGASGPKPRGRAAAHPDTLSLNEHLASRGGLRPDPELEAIYGNKRGPFVPGFGPLIRKGGMSLDDALSSAKQHGYMFDPHDAENGTAGAGGRTSHGLTPNDLLDHLDSENRGQKLYKAGHV